MNVNLTLPDSLRLTDSVSKNQGISLELAFQAREHYHEIPD